MSNEKMIEELEKLKKDPKVKEAIEKRGMPKEPKETIVFLAGLAKEFGYDLTEESIQKAIQAAQEQRKAETEASAAELESLSDDDVGQVAGGAMRKANCRYSYLDLENCWQTDGCDRNYQDYADYQCAHNYAGKACGMQESMACQQVFSPCSTSALVEIVDVVAPG